MKIPYLLLTDGTLVISLSSGPTVLSTKSVNYQKVLRALTSHTTEDTILQLVNGVLEDGLWYAYENKQQHLVIYHLDANFESSVTDIYDKPSSIDSSCTLLGTYISRDSLIAGHPEYFI